MNHDKLVILAHHVALWLGKEMDADNWSEHLNMFRCLPSVLRTSVCHDIRERDEELALKMLRYGNGYS